VATRALSCWTLNHCDFHYGFFLLALRRFFGLAFKRQWRSHFISEGSHSIDSFIHGLNGSVRLSAGPGSPGFVRRAPLDRAGVNGDGGTSTPSNRSRARNGGALVRVIDVLGRSSRCLLCVPARHSLPLALCLNAVCYGCCYAPPYSRTRPSVMECEGRLRQISWAISRGSTNLIQRRRARKRTCNGGMDRHERPNIAGEKDAVATRAREKRFKVIHITVCEMHEPKRWRTKTKT